MYNPTDTIVAVSSPTNDNRVIIRISGLQSIDILNQIFRPLISGNPGITSGKIMDFDCLVYFFRQPHSYTGDDLAEIHLWANPAITDSLIERLLLLGARPAGPGEFTARAYLNGKIDLAQAEAVNEIIVSSNKFQLAAAEKLLSGRLSETTGKIRSELMDCLAYIEAGLDFSGEDIELETGEKSVRRLSVIKEELERLASDSIACESTLDLPAVGIAGAPNAGKSTLLNKLLGKQRSIVSDKRKTTRDVLTGELTLKHCRCVLFDCAGLITQAETILDELTQQAAIQAIRNAAIVIFCVDIAKDDWAEDLAVWSHCERSEAIHLILLATKTDLVSESELAKRTTELTSLFGYDFLPISAKTGTDLEQLQNAINKKLIEITLGNGGEKASGVAITARHKQAVTEAIENISESINELKAGNDEVAAMLLRAAYHNISDIEQQHTDEKILDRIFSRFCIGK